MKKIIYTFAGIMLTTTLMVGCSAKAANTQSEQTTQSASTDDSSTKQKDFQKADLEGEVSSVNGNTVTLKIIKTPDKSAEGAHGMPNNDSDKAKPMEDNKDGEAPKIPENMKVEYTGETKDITISDGIQIKSMSMGKEGPESKDIAATDIKVGDVLQITYSDKEKETISTINVRSAAN